MGNAAAYNRIGGTDTGAGNVLSDNQYGASIYYTSSFNTIEGKCTGTDASGEHPIAKIYLGMCDSGGNDMIGGTTAASRNVIPGSHNDSVGIESTSYVLTEASFIGGETTGTADLSKLGGGVLVSNGASFNTIGGMGPEAADTIAINDGISVMIGLYRYEHGLYNSVDSSSIHANTGFGIDPGNDGGTLHSPGSQLFGPTHSRSYPVSDSAVGTANNTAIAGTLDNSSGTTFTIQSFSNPSADAFGYGYDQGYLDSTIVTTDSNGDASPSFTIDIAVPSGQVIRATATDLNGHASEFSQDHTVTARASQAPIQAGSPLLGLQAKDELSSSVNAVDMVLSMTNQPDDAALLELAMELTRNRPASSEARQLKWFHAAPSMSFQRRTRGSSVEPTGRGLEHRNAGQHTTNRPPRPN
jgi:hypothetical protein